MGVVRWWVEFPVVGGRGWGVPLVYECCKMVDGTPCRFGVGGFGAGVPLVYECCKMVGGTPCVLGIGGGDGGPFSV